MPLDLTRLCAEAMRDREEFQRRIAGVPYERKGILFSEMYFLYLCARHAAPRRILESGRARGQSTLLLSLLFPELPVISLEHDPASPDVAVANERLRGRANVDLRFGDATKILPAEVQSGDIVLIDGPKGFRGLRLALRLLATGRPTLVFVHDCGIGSVERAFLQARVPGVLYSDSIEFAQVAQALDAECWADMPSDRRFNGKRVPVAYGYGLACLQYDASVSYRRLLARAVIDSLLHRYLKRLSPLS